MESIVASCQVLVIFSLGSRNIELAELRHFLTNYCTVKYFVMQCSNCFGFDYCSPKIECVTHIRIVTRLSRADVYNHELDIAYELTFFH